MEFTRFSERFQDLLRKFETNELFSKFLTSLDMDVDDYFIVEEDDVNDVFVYPERIFEDFVMDPVHPVSYKRDYFGRIKVETIINEFQENLFIITYGDNSTDLIFSPYFKEIIKKYIVIYI